MDMSIVKKAAQLHPDEIMQPYDLIMEKSGFDAVCTFADFFGGLTIYVPKTRTIFLQCLAEEARKEYNGINLPAVSHKYGFTERHLRRLVT